MKSVLHKKNIIMKQLLITFFLFIVAISSYASSPSIGSWLPGEDRSITIQNGTEIATLSLAADYESCQIQLDAIKDLVVVIRTESGESVYMDKVSTASALTYGISLKDLKPGMYTLELNLGSEKWNNEFIIK